MPTPFIELDKSLQEIIDKASILQSPLGDDLFVSMRLDATTAGTAKTAGTVLENLLFFPTKFLLDPTMTNIFDKWYPGGVPFTETTVTITWSSAIKFPVVAFIRNRSLISIVMPIDPEKPTGEFKTLLEIEFPGPKEAVTGLLHLSPDPPSKIHEAAYFHYTFGDKLASQPTKTPRELKQACIRALVWDPRGFLHSVGDVQSKITKITDPAKPGGEVADLPEGTRVRVPNPTEDADERDNAKLTANIEKMSLTIQLNLVITENAVNPEKFLKDDDGIGSMPVLPRCNVGQATYDPSTGTFVLNGQHYTLANWPQNPGGE